MFKLSPYASLACLLFLFVISGVLQFSSSFNNNVDVYFSSKNETYRLNEAMDALFPDGDNFILLLEGDDLFETDVLTNLDQAVREIKSVQHLDRVITLTTQDHIKGTDDGFEITTLFDFKHDMALSPEQRKEKVLSDRFAPGLSISHDGRAIAMVLRPNSEAKTTERIALRDDALAILEKYGLGGKVKAISGTSEMLSVQFQSMFDSLKTFVPLIVLINLGFVFWLFPRRLVFLMLLPVLGIASQVPVSLLALLQQDFTLIHTMTAPLMSALCMAVLIHYLNRIKYYSQLGIPSHIRALRAQADVFKPAGFAVMTTATGLLSLSLSPIPPVQSFGFITAFGTCVIFVTVLFLLPPIFARWDPDAPWPKGRTIDTLLDGLTRGCARLAIRRSKAVLIATGVVLLCGSWFLLNIRAETNVFGFYRDTHHINVDTREIEQKLSGVTTIDLFLRGTEGSLKKPYELSYMIALQNWLESQPEVDRTMSYAQMVEQMHAAFHGDDMNYRVIPDNPALIAQYLFIADSQDMYEFVTPDYDKSRISVSLSIHEAGEIAVLMKRIDAYIQDNVLDGVKIDVTGFGSLYADLAHQVVITQIYSLLLALVIIFAFMILIFKSIPDGFLCMIPNLSPVLLIFILMGALGIWLDMGTAMIASIGVGIAVDDTIHLYHSYIQRKRAGYSSVYSLMRAYRHVGRSVMATTLVLASQFLVIGLSDFSPTRNFGILSAVGVVTALIFDLLVLPALIIFLSYRKIQVFSV